MILCNRLPLSIATIIMISCCLLLFETLAASYPSRNSGGAYPVVDTVQERCFNNTREISYPDQNTPLYGQDAQYRTNTSSYQDNNDGTVNDLVPRLMWQKNPDLQNRSAFSDALANAKTFRLAVMTTGGCRP